MKLKSYHRKAKEVSVKWLTPGEQGKEDVNTLDCVTAPLDELENAMQCLRDVICSIMELPLHWMETVQVRSLSVSYTKAGTRSVQVGYTKALRCGKVEAYKTPLFQIDPPDESENEPKATTTEETIAVCAAIQAAENYINGDRKNSDCQAITHGIVEDPNQATIPLDEDSPEPYDEDPEA